MGLGGLLYDTCQGAAYTPGVSQRVGGADTFFDSDWLGSTRYLMDSTGNNYPSGLRYDAFGNRTATGGAYDPSPFQFAGGWGYQSEFATGPEAGTGLEYLDQRYYDPATGRFISQDPAGTLPEANLYVYSDNDPVNRVDPTGLQAEGEPFESPEEVEAEEEEIARLEQQIQEANERGFQQLLARHGITPEQFNAEINSRLFPNMGALPEFIAPRGFASARQFGSFVGRFRAAGGDPCAVIGVRGSSTTGASFRTGEPFGPKSDIDFFIASDEVFNRAVAAGARPTRGALQVKDTRYIPELRAAELELKKELGRKLSIRIFSNAGYGAYRNLRDVIGR